MNNKEIVISIAADSRKFLSGIDEALKDAEKKIQKNNIPKVLRDKFRIINTEIASCQKQISAMLDSVSDVRQTDSALKSMTKDLTDGLNEIQKMLKSLNTAHLDIDSSSVINLNSLLSQLEDTVSQFNIHFSELQKAIKDTSTAAEHFSSTTNWISVTSKKSSQNIKAETDSLKSAISQLKNIQPNLNTLATVNDILSNSIGSLSSRFEKLTIVGHIIDLIKKMASSVVTLDNCFTKIRLTSDQNASSLKVFQQNSFIVGNSIGTAAEDIQKAATAFLNAGYNLNQAENMVKNISMFAHANSIGTDQAAQQMFTAINNWGNQFKNESDASQAIIDRYTLVAKTFGTTTEHLTSIAEQSAGSFQKSGNNMNETLGLMVSSNIIGQNIGDTASALELLSLRIRGAKSELEAMGYDVNDLSNSTSDLKAEIKALTGIDVMIDDSIYKSAAQIVQQIGVVYKDLDTSGKNTLLQKLVGNEDTSAIKNLLENYEILTSVIETSQNANGSVAEANALYLDTVIGKTELLKNQFQELASVSISDDFIKGILDSTTTFLKALTEIISLLGPMPTLLTTISGIALFKNFGRLTKSPLLNHA